MSAITTPEAKGTRTRIGPAAFPLLLTLTGLAYRATFVTQGFNATDEGWLQSVGRRITRGQVPYRDFRFALPPVSIYKEALLQWALGDAYTILASRWVFVIEATIGSVLAYLILARFIPRTPAFLLALPTIFFSVLLYYFSNYTYDGAILALAATYLLVSSDRRWVASGAGVCACLAALAKPTYAAFVVLVPGIAIAGGLISARAGCVPQPALRGFYRRWPYFAAGAAVTFLLVLAFFAVEGAAPDYTQQAFFDIGRISANRLGGAAIWLNLPTAFAPRELELFAIVLVLLVVAALGILGRFTWAATAAIALGLVYYGLWFFRGDAGFIPMAMGLLLVIDVAALAISAIVRLPRISSAPRAVELGRDMPPIELIVIAVAMQYLAQFTFSGVIYSYLGAYLSVPIAIWTLYALGDHSSVRRRDLAVLHSAIFGLWLGVASVFYVQNHVYFDQPRNELTAQFHTAKLRGVSSSPANVQRVDGVVELVDRYSKPGDPILAFPDFGCIYYLTDRANATNQDWYLTFGNWFVTPSEVNEAIGELETNPPKVIVMQTVSEFDWSRTGGAIDWSASPLQPLHDYVLQHYTVVGVVGDIMVLVPQDGA